MARARALSLVVLLAACHDAAKTEVAEAEVAPAGDAPDARPPWQRIDVPSLAACGVCHLAVYDEWEQSLHHRSWTNRNVREETGDFAQAGCRPCHSPQPVLPTGLDHAPTFRDCNEPDGVHCLSCHGLADGVAAARDVPDAPCRPKYTPQFLTAQSCWPCHEPTHHAFQEYERSDAKAIGLRCADCHMPQAPDRVGRSHGPNGGLNPDFVKRALAWSCALDGGDVVVTLRNRTGHRFPGEIPSRVFQVKLAVDGGEPRYVTFRKPGKTETREDDRLDVNETRVLRFPVAADARDVRVTLLFKPFPVLPDDAAFRIGEWSPPAK
jgi:nitrate/TMAO reductase-like tetraheme cytochrome c subunit